MMYHPAFGVLVSDEDVKINFTGEFDGLRTFEHIHDLIPPAGGVGRVILDFSDSSRARPIELYYLLAELAMDPRFGDIEISIEGLHCNRMDGRSQNGRNHGKAQAHAGSSAWLDP
jgi:hypothetical protein